MEPEPSPQSAASGEMWRAILMGTDRRYARARRVLQRLPGHPRCKMCAAPFGGIGAPLMRLVGRRRWPKNPKYCGMCFSLLQANHGGAEIECSLLFADVRGSTTLAEGITPAQFSRLMARFYETATDVLVERDAIVEADATCHLVETVAASRHGEKQDQGRQDAESWGRHDRDLLPGHS